MPVKRRIEKRRIDPQAELKIWANVFGHGCDWFSEVADHTGLTEPVHVRWDHERAQAEVLWRAASEEAWARLGERYLPSHDGDEMAWAEEQFGRPWEANHAS